MNDIFTNEDNLKDNIDDSIKDLGGDPKKVLKSHENPIIPVPKKNCKLCWGRGYLKYFEGTSKNSKDLSVLYCKCVKHRRLYD